ncbi:hypothetical protein D9M71_455830 [compost metagenome]
MPPGNAVLVPGLLVQAHFAGAQHGLPLLVEADAVADEQAVLAAVQAPLAGANGFIGRIEGRGASVDVAGAEPLIVVRALIQRAPLRTAAHGQLMPYAQCIETPVEHGLRLIGAAGVVGAAEVVDVVVAIAAEECTLAGTPGKRAVVVDHHLAARGTQGAGPGLVEAVLEAPAQVQRVVLHRLGPVLVGQAVMRVDAVGHFAATEQLITGHRTLFAVLVLGIQLQGGIRADLPVEGQRGEVALAVGVVDVGTDVFMGQVGPQAKLLFAAKPAAQVGGQIAFALFVGR